MENRIYAVIDLKCYFASCECVVRGLDPFKTNLVVADPSRGGGAICLAITPAMKELGIRNRCRVYEIPKNVNYFTAPPRMKLYMQYSAEIYSIYCKFISPDDIHVYSIDECFLDFTPYLRTYHKTPKELAVMIMDEIFDRTGICATAGIGTNMFLAKVALDITAKHVPDHIGYLDETEFMCTIQRHRPITDIWNIGNGIANKLKRYGVLDLKGVAAMDKKQLFKMFGINAQFLIDHAVGKEPCTMQDIKNYKSKSRSFSNSQILFEDYNYQNARLVLREMIDGLVLEMIEKHLVTDNISLFIGYSKDIIKPAVKSMKIGEYTNSFRKLIEFFLSMYDNSVCAEYPVRRIGISLNELEDEEYKSFTLFTDTAAEEREENCQRAIIEIKNRYGKNAVLRGISYEDKATARTRNTLIGGHHA